MSLGSSKHDFMMRWLRRAFWYVLSGGLAFAVVAGIFFGVALLTACPFAVLRALLPSLRSVRSEWLLLISTIISVLLMGLFIYMDNLRWHIGERLRKLRDGDKDSSP
jgi:ABC-type antimicrobial peptide transport system permease subunit